MDGKFVGDQDAFWRTWKYQLSSSGTMQKQLPMVKELGGNRFDRLQYHVSGKQKECIRAFRVCMGERFTPLTVGCPVIIGDGLKGTDDIEVPVEAVNM